MSQLYKEIDIFVDIIDIYNLNKISHRSFQISLCTFKNDKITLP